MKLRFLTVLGFGLAAVLLSPLAAVAAPGDHATLQAFRSSDELERYLKPLLRAHRTRAMTTDSIVAGLPPPPAMAAQAVGALPDHNTSEALQRVPGITNNQVENVDEGDIVKAAGNFLVVLRRGRLFTLSTAEGGLRLVDTVDAYPPGVDPRGDWYDEMLIGNGRVVVIGYSYARHGTQVIRFRLSRDGHLAYEDAYAIKSNDYYSANNYSSRLIGNKLVFYSPRYFGWGWNGDVDFVLPGYRRFRPNDDGAFRTIGGAHNVYVAPGMDPQKIAAIHTVTACDLTAPEMTCTATSVLGPEGRVFFVSGTAVYIWTASWQARGNRSPNMLYRLPLDGSTPTAVEALGAPVDQFSFRETSAGLDVLVRAGSAGEAMWASRRASGAIALVHIPFSAFADGRNEIDHRFYRDLPQPENSTEFHNRFVGDYLFYGGTNGWQGPQRDRGTLIVVPAGGGPLATFALPHGVERIEVMGGDGVVIGSSGDNLVFTAVALKPGRAPVIADSYTLAGAAQGESRSHGFFFHPEINPASNRYDGDFGVLGLPVTRPFNGPHSDLLQESAAVVFLRRSEGRFILLGELSSHPGSARDDACLASCFDWYGNSRPIFYGSRTFALMGYELVEGALGERDIVEKARVDFNPGVPQPARD